MDVAVVSLLVLLIFTASVAAASYFLGERKGRKKVLRSSGAMLMAGLDALRELEREPTKLVDGRDHMDRVALVRAALSDARTAYLDALDKARYSFEK